MPNQRDFDSLQSLIDGQDQRFRNVYFVPIDNPINGNRTIYVEKRPGFEVRLTPAAGCPGTDVFYSSVQDKFISAFCGDDVYVGTTPVGSSSTCNPILQCSFDNNSIADVSGNSSTASITGSDVHVDGGVIHFPGTGATELLTYTGGVLDDYSQSTYTIEMWIWADPGLAPGGLGAPDFPIIHYFEDPNINGYDTRLVLVRNPLSVNYSKIYHRNSNIIGFQYSNTTIPLSTWMHLAYSVEFIPGSGVGTLRMYFDGQKVLETTTAVSQLPAAASAKVNLGGGSAAYDSMFKIDDLRISPCFLYHQNFTPPPRGSLPTP